MAECISDSAFRFYSEFYAGALLSCLVNILSFSVDSSAFEVVSLSLACFFLALFLCYPLAVSVDIFRKFDTLPEVYLHERYPRWLRDIRADTKGRSMFQSLFFFKRLSIGLLLTLANSWKWTQIICINLTTAISLSLCVLLRPYEHSKDNAILIVTEAGTLLTGFCMILINANVASEATSVTLISVIFVVVLLSLLVEFTHVIVLLCK